VEVGRIQLHHLLEQLVDGGDVAHVGAIGRVVA
jgi:hypothetical protein